MKSIFSFINNLFGNKEEAFVKLYNDQGKEVKKEEIIDLKENKSEEKVTIHLDKNNDIVNIQEKEEINQQWYTSFDEEKDLDENYYCDNSREELAKKKKLEEIFEPLKIEILRELIEEAIELEYEEDSESSF
jgi:hypothetical protein